MATIEERAKAISEGYDYDGYSAGLSLIENYKSQLREDVYVRLKSKHYGSQG